MTRNLEEALNRATKPFSNSKLILDNQEANKAYQVAYTDICGNLSVCCTLSKKEWTIYAKVAGQCRSSFSKMDRLFQLKELLGLDSGGELSPDNKALIGRIVEFKTCSNVDSPLLRGNIEHKAQLGFITYIDGVMYELRKAIIENIY